MRWLVSSSHTGRYSETPRTLVRTILIAVRNCYSCSNVFFLLSVMQSSGQTLLKITKSRKSKSPATFMEKFSMKSRKGDAKFMNTVHKPTRRAICTHSSVQSEGSQSSNSSPGSWKYSSTKFWICGKGEEQPSCHCTLDETLTDYGRITCEKNDVKKRK